MTVVMKSDQSRFLVVPAHAGTQRLRIRRCAAGETFDRTHGCHWTPDFAGMTKNAVALAMK